MKTTFTKTYIRKNKGCYTLKQVNSLSFINNDEITINDVLKSEISLSDKIWFCKHNCYLKHGDKVRMFKNIKNCLLPENKWLVWSVNHFYFWIAFSTLPGSEQKNILKELIKFFNPK